MVGLEYEIVLKFLKGRHPRGTPYSVPGIKILLHKVYYPFTKSVLLHEVGLLRELRTPLLTYMSLLCASVSIHVSDPGVAGVA